MKKHRLVLLTSILALIPVFALADTDDFIFTGPIANTYYGRPEAPELISNLDFDDLPGTFWAKDAVVRSGALNLIKGYSGSFAPDAPVANEEAVAYLLRAINMEGLSHDAALRLRNTLPPDTPTLNLWSLGYLSQALDIGLITQGQFNDAMVFDQALLDPAINFIRSAPVTREQAADWILRSLQSVNSAIFQLGRTEQSIYRYKDWQGINPEWVHAVEMMLESGIMTGDENNLFRPKSSLRRAEMAQILKNMDSLYYSLLGIEKKTGTVGGIRDAQSVSTAVAGLNRDIYVRTADGLIDVLRYSLNQSSSPMPGVQDSVVLRGGSVGGLPLLREGDEVEYLVRTGDYALMYVQVTNAQYLSMKKLQGILQSINMPTGKITVSDAQNKTYEYTMAVGVCGLDNNNMPFIRFSGQKMAPSEIPVGTRVEISLKNNIVDSIEYLGEPALVKEKYGIVLGNNPSMGYMDILAQDRQTVSMRYCPSDVLVERKAGYDSDDEIGYIDSLFTNYKFDPADTKIGSISVGDIVSFRASPSDEKLLAEIYAYANYHAVYGKIKMFQRRGKSSDMLVEYEGGQTAWFTMPDSIYASKSGAPISISDIQVGDWAKLLISSATFEPGRTMESVKEIDVEGGGHYISRIVMGTLGGIDAVQDKLILRNARSMSKAGWGDSKQVEQLKLAGSGTEYYYDNRRISAGYAESRLKHAEGQVYAALEDNYVGERVRKLSFRGGRDETLPPDIILGADGGGGFHTSQNGSRIFADLGAIVRRHGRLTDASAILPGDYAAVNLNGAGTAAIVDIMPRPDTSGLLISRGRITEVNEGRNFRVESMALLYGAEWSYTPVRRLFAIDGETLFVSSAGIQPGYPFRGYTEDSAIGRVFNIVLDGSRAARVVEAPYCVKAIRGVVYEIGANSIGLRSAAYYENGTGKWRAISKNNASAQVAVPPNAIIVKGNALIESQSLKPGDHLRILTDSLPDQIGPGLQATGYIISAER